MTQDDIKRIFDAYLQAELRVLEGKTVTLDGQSMSLENLSEIRKGREYWERRYTQSRAGRQGSPRYKLARFL